MKYIATQIDTSDGPIVNTWTEYDHPGIKAWSSECHGMSVIADDIPGWDYAESCLEEAWDYKDAILSGKWPKNDTYLNVRGFIHHNLPLREYNSDEVRRIIDAFRHMFQKANPYCDVGNDDVCAVLSVVHGRHYRVDAFKGYSQGDYIEIAYAEEDWPNKSIGYVAADAFGQYDEYDISSEDDNCGYCCQVYHYFGCAPCGTIAEQLKDIIGLKSGDTLVIRTLNGSGRWTPDYDNEEVVVA